MKKLLLLLLSPFFVQAQLHYHGGTPCLYDHGVVMMDQQFPGYKDRVNQTFEEAKRLGSQNLDSRNVLTIPVVFHVVWKNAAENLPQAKIQEQLDVLNECYRRRNADTVNLRQFFVPIAGDPMIEFVLAGVERVQTTVDFEPDITGGLADEVKQTSQGGSDAWDTDHYLNIWICDIKPITFLGIPLGEILGYAYPPAGLSNWPSGSSAPSPNLDGVVLDYLTIGRGTTLQMNTGGPTPVTLNVEGRTAVHEVGHYLGLRHIWGDGGGLGGGNSCNADDGCNDTPNQGAQSEFNCDQTQNTCGSGPQDSLDMIENFMDYSSELCQNSFTRDQIAIMRGVLAGPRAGLTQPVSVTQQNELAMEIYPNPNQGTFNIVLDNRFNGEVKVSIFDCLGREVFFGNYQIEGQNNINISTNLSNGLYFVTIENNLRKVSKKISISQ